MTRSAEPKLHRAQGLFLDLLATLVAQYESQAFPAPKASAADVLEHLTEERGVTKAVVAQATGIARQAVAHAVQDDRPISRANAIKLARYFGVSPELFLDEEPHRSGRRAAIARCESAK